MPLYYFDIVQDGVLSTDEFGIELDDVFEAREQALALLPDIARGHGPDRDHHEFVAVVRSSGTRIRYRTSLIIQGEWVEPPDHPEEA